MNVSRNHNEMGTFATLTPEGSQKSDHLERLPETFF